MQGNDVRVLDLNSSSKFSQDDVKAFIYRMLFIGIINSFKNN